MPEPHGVVVKVMATGVCRSDWHGWVGHDADIRLPHVPGHELAGIVEAVGKDVTNWKKGDRVTVPFVAAAALAPSATPAITRSAITSSSPASPIGAHSPNMFPSITPISIWCDLPETIDFATAASLGCRFVTSFRAIVDQGRVSAGQWVAVHGCGGVGLSAIMIANALGAQVIAIDIADQKLELAKSLGAVATVNAGKVANVVEAVMEITKGGAHVSVDALGHATTCFNSISNLRKARQAHSGGAHAGRTQHAANSHGQGHCPRT